MTLNFEIVIPRNYSSSNVQIVQLLISDFGNSVCSDYEQAKKHFWAFWVVKVE